MASLFGNFCCFFVLAALLQPAFAAIDGDYLVVHESGLISTKYGTGFSKINLDTPENMLDLFNGCNRRTSQLYVSSINTIWDNTDFSLMPKGHLHQLPNGVRFQFKYVDDHHITFESKTSISSCLKSFYEAAHYVEILPENMKYMAPHYLKTANFPFENQTEKVSICNVQATFHGFAQPDVIIYKYLVPRSSSPLKDDAILAFYNAEYIFYFSNNEFCRLQLLAIRKDLLPPDISFEKLILPKPDMPDRTKRPARVTFSNTQQVLIISMGLMVYVLLGILIRKFIRKRRILRSKVKRGNYLSNEAKLPILSRMEFFVRCAKDKLPLHQ